jgi:hypothetical protein
MATGLPFAAQLTSNTRVDPDDVGEDSDSSLSFERVQLREVGRSYRIGKTHN